LTEEEIMPKYLSKSDVLGKQDRVYEDVPVPEWDGVVRVQSLMGTEKDAFEASLTTIQQVGRRYIQRPYLVNVRAKFAAACMVDEDGKLLFDPADVLELGRKSGAALDRVLDVAKRLSRMSEDDLDKLTGSLKNGQPAALPTD
jgi:hypothetical protein